MLTKLPPRFLNDLLDEDRTAISSVLAKPVLLRSYDDAGRAEIEFTDSRGVRHFLYVSPDCISATRQ